jgi:ribonuclease BN (tRNA processing enzyme)
MQCNDQYHSHADHIASLPHHVRVRTMRGDKRSRYFLPRECIAQFFALYGALYALDNHIESGVSIAEARQHLDAHATVNEAILTDLTPPVVATVSTSSTNSAASSTTSTNGELPGVLCLRT